MENKTETKTAAQQGSDELFGAMQASPDGAPSPGQGSSYQFEAGWRMIDRFVIKNGRLDAAPRAS
ncbi:hypothetical protein N7509_005567 [Penicillium cosmopolitanum]|uniref:Uncharacterized protein n=1 Tax=Penicillium cosmopolitanum TaxID=1131564 RepID=A0A9W9W2G2_9EURO|nr:uncharacterized protein N7509_005567 [Penicillium cosmopolitanum]KAJ5397454.1 hypothetical protein N7509_005567 [Penicillium cosmopolitanum]